MADRVRSPRLSPQIYANILICCQGRGAPRGGAARGGGSGAARGGKASQPSMDKPKRDAILDLSKYTNERVRVKFTGGREGKYNVYQSEYMVSLTAT